ncbi:MAG: hypothetical protein ACR2KT_00915 [Methylocella sp.]
MRGQTDGAARHADNLAGIFAALNGETKQNVLRVFGGGNFSTFKSALVDLAVAKLGPICAEMQRLKDDPAFIDGVLVDGAGRARAIAAENMACVKDILGFCCSWAADYLQQASHYGLRSRARAFFSSASAATLLPCSFKAMLRFL